jgi:hypothetical protein
VDKECEEGVLIEDAHIVCFILFEDIAEVDFEEALEEGAEDHVKPDAILNRGIFTNER